jgi:hypothetical protein
MKFLEMLNDFFMSIINFFLSIFSSLNKKENNKESFDMSVLRLGGKKKRTNKK